MALGHGVEAADKVGSVLLLEASTAHGVLLIVLVDASGRKDGAVNTSLGALIGQRQSANDVGANRLLLVVLAPVNVGSASAARGVEDVRGLDLVEHLGDTGDIFHADSGAGNLLALLLEELLEVASHPALAAPDEEAVGRRTVGSRHDDGVGVWV